MEKAIELLIEEALDTTNMPRRKRSASKKAKEATSTQAGPSEKKLEQDLKTQQKKRVESMREAYMERKQNIKRQSGPRTVTIVDKPGYKVTMTTSQPPVVKTTKDGHVYNYFPGTEFEMVSENTPRRSPRSDSPTSPRRSSRLNAAPVGFPPNDMPEGFPHEIFKHMAGFFPTEPPKRPVPENKHHADIGQDNDIAVLNAELSRFFVLMGVHIGLSPGKEITEECAREYLVQPWVASFAQRIRDLKSKLFKSPQYQDAYQACLTKSRTPDERDKSMAVKCALMTMFAMEVFDRKKTMPKRFGEENVSRWRRSIGPFYAGLFLGIL